eukprot:4958260-Pyramimonas_sp.AAC.1
METSPSKALRARLDLAYGASLAQSIFSEGGPLQHGGALSGRLACGDQQQVSNYYRRHSGVRAGRAVT